MIVTVNLNPVLDRTLALPHLAVGEINRARLLRLDVGGKGFNVSRALLELSTPSLALGVLGGGTGEVLRRGLEQLDIPGEFIPVEGESRQNMTILDESTGQYTKINEEGPHWTGDTVEALLARVKALVNRGDAWVMAGRLPPGAPEDLYAQLIRLIQSAGGRAYLDSSGAPLRLGCEAAPFGVKPNEVEAEEVVGRPLDSQADLLDAAQVFLTYGTQVVALSLGERGALLVRSDEAVLAVPPAVRVRSTVGAGDAFMAGLVRAMETGERLPEAARWAVAAGTAAAMQEGTGVGTEEEVTTIASQVELKTI